MRKLSVSEAVSHPRCMQPRGESWNVIWGCLNSQPVLSTLCPRVSGPGRRPKWPIHVFLIVLKKIIKENKLVNESILSGSRFLSKHGVAVILKKDSWGCRVETSAFRTCHRGYPQPYILSSPWPQLSAHSSDPRQ